MPLDLYNRESLDRISSLQPMESPEPGVFDGFVRGTGLYTMRGFASTARAIDLLGAVGPIVQDKFTGGTEAQDRYFREHDEVFGSAVDYWTPRPNEVGQAAQVAGGLLSVLPTVIASPGLAVGSAQLGAGEELVKAGVPHEKAQAIGAIEGAATGLGVWMPILGRNGWERIFIGGAGYNALQGVATRGAAHLILADHEAAKQYEAFDPTALTLDVLLGMAFGSLAHLSPEQRAQGARGWEKINRWVQGWRPSDVDAVAALRQAQHLNVDSVPGKPVGPEDIAAHVDRVSAAIDQLAKDKPVEVSDQPEPRVERQPAKDEADRIRMIELAQMAELERVREVVPNYPKVEESLQGYRGAPTMEQLLAEAEARLKLPEETPEQAAAALAEFKARIRVIEQGKLARGEIPDVFNRVRIMLEGTGKMTQEEAMTNAKVHAAFYEATAKRIGTTPEQLFERYPLQVTTEAAPAGAMEQPEFKPGVSSYGWTREPYYRGMRTAKEAGGMPSRNPFPDGSKESAEWERGWREGWRQRIEDKEARKDVLFQSPVRPEPIFYSELQRQVEALPLDRVPETGLEAKQWKQLLKKPASARLVAIRDERNRPTGQTKQVYTPEQPALPGVKAEEMKWSGIEDWLDAQGGKVTKEQVVSFLRNGGVRVAERQFGGELERTPQDTIVAERTKRLEEAGFHFDMDPEGGRWGLVTPDGDILLDRSDVLQAFGEDRFTVQQTAAGWTATTHAGRSLGVVVHGIGMNEAQARMQVRRDHPEAVKLDPKFEDIAHDASLVLEHLNNTRAPETHFASYQLPGAKNYRELILTLPSGEPTVKLEPDPSLWTKRTEDMNLRSRGGGTGEHNVWEATINDHYYMIVEMAREPEGRVDPTRRYVVDGGGLTNAGSGTLEEAMVRAQYHEQHPEVMYVGGAREAIEGKLKAPSLVSFQSSHFPDVENPIAHIRFNDRTDAEGKKVLFIEEIQSDWAQKGKSEGFKPAGPMPRELPEGAQVVLERSAQDKVAGGIGAAALVADSHEAALKQRDYLISQGVKPEDIIVAERPVHGGDWLLFTSSYHVQDANGDFLPHAGSMIDTYSEAGARKGAIEGLQERYGDQQKRNIPAAPFVGKTESWVALSLKRMIRYAAEHGYDRIAWTTGEQQVERYTNALRERLDSIDWKKTPQGVQLIGYKGGSRGSPIDPAIRQRAADVLALNDYLGFDTESEALYAVLEHADDWQNRWQVRGNADAAAINRYITAVREGREAPTRHKVVDTTEKEDELSDAIGKAMADKIRNDPARTGTLEGADLRIDDTGMAGFYDRIVPAVANDVLKKLGGGKVHKATGTTQHAFDITPALRERATKALPLFQGGEGAARGYYKRPERGGLVGLLQNADRSTFMHESGHFYLDVLNELAAEGHPDLQADRDILLDWFGVKDAEAWDKMDLEARRPYHEQFARGFEQYLGEGVAPTPGLAGVFERFKQWLADLYQTLTTLNVKMSDDVRGVMARMLGGEHPAQAAETPARAEPPPPPETRQEAPGAIEGIQPPAEAEPAQPAPAAAPPVPAPAAEAAPEIQAPATRPGKLGKGTKVELTPQEALGLRELGREAGWEQMGGRLDRSRLTDPDKLGGAPAFTSWVPKADWWVGFVRDKSAKLNEVELRRAIEKAAAGEPLRAQEARAIEYLRPLAHERLAQMGEATVEAMLEREAIQAEPKDPLEATAERFVSDNPDLQVAIGQNADGTAQTVRARDYLDAARARTKRAQDDAELFTIAADCLLGGGR